MKKTMKKRKKRGKRLGIIVFTFIGIAVLGVGSYFAIEQYFKNEPKPEELLGKYMAYISKHDYENMYMMLDEQSQTIISKEDFISRNQKIYEGIEAEHITLAIQKLEDGPKSEMTVFYTLSMDTVAGKLSFDHEATFHKVRKRGYCLEWNHDMIFPNLKGTDKVRVSRREAKRGNIFDRNGVMLAGKGTASAVGLVPGKMSEKAQDDITKLAEFLDTSTQSVQKKIAAKWVKADSWVPIKTIEKVEPVELLSAEPDPEVLQNENLQNKLLEIPGVMISDVEVRIYPLKEKASHLTGYVQNITIEELKEHKKEGYNSSSVIGKSGLEKLYEGELRGIDGYEIKIVTADGEEKETLALKLQKDGKDVVLSIDAKLQSALYEKFSEDKSCSVAMNPKTGEVLALVSTPSFNANDFVMGMSESKWQELNANENKPLLNRFRAAWCPGSSFKPVIAAIGVSTATLDPNEDFGNVGRSWQKDAGWGSYYVTTLHEYDDVTMKNALIYSDNIYFAKAALKIGADTLIQQLNKVGFGERVPFDIWMNESQYSNNEIIEGEVQLADTGYGQGQVLMSPLHLASIYTAFVNDGSMMTPYLRDEGVKKPAYWKENIFTKEAINLVKDALVQTIESLHGTARACRIDSVSLAGKTGTAEIKASKEDTSGTELGWFAVFTAEKGADDAILIISMAEDVKGRGGSTYVVKKDKEVLEQIYVKGD